MEIRIPGEKWQMIFESSCIHSKRPCDACVKERKKAHIKSLIKVESIRPV
jgi:hypothetical protein